MSDDTLHSLQMVILVLLQCLLQFMDCATGEWMTDELKKAKFTSLQFTRDSKGFFYSVRPDLFFTSYLKFSLLMVRFRMVAT